MTDNANNHIVEKLQENYKLAAIEYASQEFELLSSLAKKNLPPITVCDGGISNLVLMIICLIPLAFFTSHAILGNQVGLAIIFITIILVLIWQAIKVYQGIGQAMFTISEQGIKLPIFKQITPWEDLEHFYISQTHKLVLNFHLKQDFPTSEFISGTTKISYNSEKQHIQVMLLNYRNRKNSAYYQNLLTDYWNAGIAKARLKELAQYP